MTSSSTVLRLVDVAPECARRLVEILAGLAAVVARRFLRDPKYFRLILPLWGWLGRVGRRFARLPLRPLAARPVRSVAEYVPVDRVRVTRPRLPAGKAWLVRALGYEAAGYGSQLEALLGEAEMQRLLAEVPAVGRLLRPLCRMLGVGAALVTPQVTQADGEAASVRAVRKPRPKRAPIWPRGRGRPWVCGPRPKSG